MISRNARTTNAAGESGRRSYERVSSRYDRTIALFTGGQNLATRHAQLEDLRPGDRALYIGVGSGEDAIEAARRGIQVTCLDLSAGMIEQARERFDEAGLSGEFICADLLHYVPERPFDAVVCNFFLNIFSRTVMEQMLTRAVSLLRPAGRLLVADFAPTRGNILLRASHKIFYRASNLIYWAQGLCPLHPIYVYADYYSQLGVRLQRTRRFRLFGKGPWVFQTTTAIKDRWHDVQVLEPAIAAPYPA